VYPETPFFGCCQNAPSKRIIPPATLREPKTQSGRPRNGRPVATEGRPIPLELSTTETSACQGGTGKWRDKGAQEREKKKKVWTGLSVVKERTPNPEVNHCWFFKPPREPKGEGRSTKRGPANKVSGDLGKFRQARESFQTNDLGRGKSTKENQ